MVRKSHTYAYARPMVTVDAVVLSPGDAHLGVLVIKRGKPPFKGKWALPGGFIEMDERLRESMARELEEETGLQGVRLEQIGTFGDPGRDPRGRTIAVVYLALVERKRHKVTAGDDAADAAWLPVSDLPRMAFDHNDIVDYALAWLRAALRYRGVGANALKEPFTMAELRRLYEIIAGEAIDAQGFGQRIAALDIVKQVGKSTKKPYRYRFKKGPVEPI